MTQITDNRVVGKMEAIIRHYFDSDVSPIHDDSNNIAILGLWGFLASLVLAFFTFGITNSEGQSYVSMFIISLGIGVFVVGCILHFLFFTFGSFYKHGVFKTIGGAIAIVLFVIAYIIAFVFGTLGGFFLSLLVASTLPSFGILAPFKIILFAIPSIWWMVKGWSLVVEGNSVRHTFDREINWMQNHGFGV